MSQTSGKSRSAQTASEKSSSRSRSSGYVHSKKDISDTRLNEPAQYQGSKTDSKYIFVTGGVLSGLGKGITAASIGNMLQARGMSVNIQKLDPYLNVDAGTLNPAEHGETYVTKDGAETDLDLGHYERFLDVELTQNSSVMSGRLFKKLIEDERSGEYLGKTVQVVPHFTNSIKQAVHKAAEGFDVHIVEIGGTVGDYESPAFFEAMRQLIEDVGQENALNVQVVYLPYLGASAETKTKPAQNAIRELRSFGILPQLIVARSEKEPEIDVRKKLTSLSGVSESGIAVLPNAPTVYEVPLSLEEQGIGDYIVKTLKLPSEEPDHADWEKLVASIKKDYKKKVNIGIVAKYLDNTDTYASVVEAIKTAAHTNDVDIEIVWIDSEKISKDNISKTLKDIDGMIVPGGFGERGVEGMIIAAEFAMKEDVPYLGICLGLQVAAIAAARGSGLKKAHSIEFNDATPDPVVHIMESQMGKEATGGTMRLGDYECKIQKDSLAHKLYGKDVIIERHRHRYEVNNEYRPVIESFGLKISGTSPDDRLVEMVEMPGAKYFIATQAHPEFRSRPTKVHPLFDGLIKASD